MVVPFVGSSAVKLLQTFAPFDARLSLLCSS